MISNGFNLTQHSDMGAIPNLSPGPGGGFLNLTHTMLPPIGATTLGTFGQGQAQQATTNPAAFMNKANSTQTSLLDSTQMQLQ